MDKLKLSTVDPDHCSGSPGPVRAWSTLDVGINDRLIGSTASDSGRGVRQKQREGDQ